MADLLVYGSYGYTGELITQEALDRGLDVVVAGRARAAVENQAARLRIDERVAALDEPQLLDLALEEAPVVINCAGPFEDTYEPMVEACLRTGTHYLDVTGEISVFEALAAADDRAREANTMLLPGVGSDVVPTDCLAAHLADRLPDASELRLGFEAEGGISPGTARTAIRGLGEGGFVRRDGRIERVPLGHRTRTIDFGRGDRTAMTIPWGDVATAYHTTGIGNVEFYLATGAWLPRLVRIARPFAPLGRTGVVRSALQSLVDWRVDGPDEEARRTGRTYVWGEVENPDGERAISRLVCPQTYRLTKLAAVTVAERVVDGEAPVGFQTPAGAYGADLILDVAGVERTDDPVEQVVVE